MYHDRKGFQIENSSIIHWPYLYLRYEEVQVKRDTIPIKLYTRQKFPSAVAAWPSC